MRVLKLMFPVTLGLGLINFNLSVDSIFATLISDAGARRDRQGVPHLHAAAGRVRGRARDRALPDASRASPRAGTSRWPARDARPPARARCCFLLVPAAALMLVLSEPITQVVYQRGEFDAAQTDLVAEALFYFALLAAVRRGQPDPDPHLLQPPAALAPTQIALANLGVNAGLDALLYKPMGVGGIPLSTAIVSLVTTVALAVVLRRRLGGHRRGGARSTRASGSSSPVPCARLWRSGCGRRSTASRSTTSSGPAARGRRRRRGRAWPSTPAAVAGAAGGGGARRSRRWCGSSSRGSRLERLTPAAPILEPVEEIRNFSIIAHIDHGKSTLADRILELTHTVDPSKMRAQVLDSMELERERGITIKAQAVRVLYTARDGKTYKLHLIDTPGPRRLQLRGLALARRLRGRRCWCRRGAGRRGADGREHLPRRSTPASSWSRCMNKIDLPSAEPERVAHEIGELLGEEPEEILRISAKTGEGVEEVLEALVQHDPAAGGRPGRAAARADLRLGLRPVPRAWSPTCGSSTARFKQGEAIRAMQAGTRADIDDIGFLSPDMVEDRARSRRARSATSSPASRTWRSCASATR